MPVLPNPSDWLTRRPRATASLSGAALLCVWVLIWHGLMPNEAGRVGVDYSLWLPDLLAGYFWQLANGPLSLPWFSPAQCGGFPLYADPQVGFVSLPQALTLIMPPLAAAQLSILAFGAAGFAGVWALARDSFRLPPAPSLLAATLWLFNGLFGARMAMGHITYAPFMLAPALAWLVLPAGAAPARHALRRALGAGLLVGLMLHAGMIHATPPLLLSVAMVILIHALRHGWSWRPAALLAAALAIGLGLAAGKLTAALALLHTLPRDLYPLPGLPASFTLLGTALHSLFWPPTNDMGRAVVHTRLIQELPEFAYGVTPLPLLLLTAWAVQALRHGARPARHRLAPALALLALAAIPLALNTYTPGWNALLKSLPFFGNSSTLLRWFSAWMLPLILGAALAATAIPALARRGPLLAAIGAACAILFAVLTPKTLFAPDRAGNYDPAPLTRAWAEARARGAPPAITAINALVDATGAGGLFADRQNDFLQGISELYCYQPLFGYRLERYPIGTLHPGLITDETDGHLNLKNPACYVWPDANHCAAGDHFPTTRLDDATAFATWHPFPFAMPAAAQAANWLSLLTLLALPLAAATTLRKNRT